MTKGARYSITKVNGLTGQTGATYTSGTTGLWAFYPVVHPDGTVFVVQNTPCVPCLRDTVVGIDSATGAQKFSVEAGDFLQSGLPIIAGDGNAYIPYVRRQTLGGSMVRRQVSRALGILCA